MYFFAKREFGGSLLVNKKKHSTVSLTTRVVAGPKRAAEKADSTTFGSDPTGTSLARVDRQDSE